MATNSAFATPVAETALQAGLTDITGMQLASSVNGVLGIAADAQGCHIGTPEGFTPAPTTFALTEVPPVV